MRGIELNKPIFYHSASLRYFKPNEHHIARTCKRDVIVMVFDGVLRFSEDGIECEVHPGEYYIQRKGGVQRGDRASDSPKYLYVHFEAEWTDGEDGLFYRGNFDYSTFRPLMESLDHSYHTGQTYINQAALFYQILALLHNKPEKETVAYKMAEYISRNLTEGVDLESLCAEFYFTKNHVINLFKKEYGVTPIVYINRLKIFRAESLLEKTSDDVESIAYAVGFTNYSHFYRLFLRKNGVSPKKWRDMKRR